MTSPNYQLNANCYRKLVVTVKIRTLFLIEFLDTDIKKKHNIVKPIHFSSRSESKKNIRADVVPRRVKICEKSNETRILREHNLLYSYIR